ncbi:MAG: DNA polymerase III subunit delta [Chthoniobacterales bacterium]
MPAAKSSSIYAVVGSDEAKIKLAARALAEKLSPPDAGEFGLEIVDGCVEGAEAARAKILEAVQALLTLPFFGGGKLVWLKNATFFADSVTGRAEAVLEAVESFSELLKKGLPPDVVLLISALDIDKRRSFYKSLGKLGEVQVFDKIETGRGNWEEQVEALVMTEARRLGLRMERDALELFVQLVGADTGQMGNELEKLDLFFGTTEPKLVTADLVRSLVARTKEGVVFDLGNAIARRDLRSALRLVDLLLRQGESAVGILLVAVIPTVRNLLVVKDLMVRHKLRPPEQPFFFGKTLERLSAEDTRHLPRKKDGTVNGYSLGIAAQSAGKYSLAELKSALTACLEANQLCVTTQLDASLVLSQVIVRVCAPAAGK